MVNFQFFCTLLCFQTSVMASQDSSPIENKLLIPLSQAIEFSEKQCGLQNTLISYQPSAITYAIEPLQCVVNEQALETPLIPAEVSTHILSFVPVTTWKDIANYRLVSKNWHGYWQHRLQGTCVILDEKNIKNIPLFLLQNIGGLFFDLSQPDFPRITQIIKNSPQVKYLGFRFSKIKENFFNAFDEAQEINLQEFFNELSSMKNLRYLDMFKTHLKVFNYRFVSSPFISELQLLNFGFNNIGKKGTTYRSLLQSLAHVQVLSLQGIKCLNDNVVNDTKTLSSLKFINLNGTNVSKKLVEELRDKPVNVFFEPYRVTNRPQQDKIISEIDSFMGLGKKS